MVQPTKKITILGIEDYDAGVRLRAAAEMLFLNVEWIGIGEAKDVTDLLNARLETDLVVLSCHGDDGDVIMPELHDDLKARQPFAGNMKPEHVRQFLKLDGLKVLNTGCSTGNSEMASAFLDAGCQWYIGPVDDPDGAAGFVFVVNFLYHHLRRNLGVEKALLVARREDDESRFYKLYREVEP